MFAQQAALWLRLFVLSFLAGALHIVPVGCGVNAEFEGCEVDSLDRKESLICLRY